MENKIKKKIGIYLRVSSRERALYGYGLDSQKEKCLSYLNLFGYDETNVKIYIDDGISGKDLNRPKMKRLINDVKERDIDMIVIYKLDRLARSVIDVYKLINLLIEHNCQLVAVMDQLDINTANGRMLVGMLAIIAQWEREVITERTIDGVDVMVEQGKYPYSKTKFGWDKDDDKFLHVNDEQAGIINHLCDMAIQGYFLSDITDELYKKYGIKRKPDIVKKWLTRIENIGLFNYKGKIKENIMPAIMSEDKRKAVIRALEKRTPRVDTSRYYYANLIYCACGKLAMQKSTNKKNKTYFYYECPNCFKRINQERILEQTLDQLFIHANKIQFNELEKSMLVAMKKIQYKIDVLFKKYKDNEIDTKSYAFTISKLQKDQQEIKSQLESLFVNSRNGFILKKDQTKKSFVQRYVASVTVDMDLKLIVLLNFKTIHTK